MTCAQLGATVWTYIAVGPVSTQTLAGITGSYGGVLLPNLDIEFAAGQDAANVRSGRPTLISNSAMIGTANALLAKNPVIQQDDWPYSLQIDDFLRVFPDGRVDVLGGADETVKVGGRRLSLTSVEATVEAHPAVLRAFAFALDSDDGADWISLAVEVGDGPTTADLAAEIAARVAETHFAAARPRQIRLSKAFPALSSGKFDRTALREIFSTSASPSSVPTEETGQNDEGDPVAIALTDWARSRGLLSPGALVLEDGLPCLSSIDLIELHLLAEELAGRRINKPLGLDKVSNWAELNEVLAAGFRQQ